MPTCASKLSNSGQISYSKTLLLAIAYGAAFALLNTFRIVLSARTQFWMGILIVITAPLWVIAALSTGDWNVQNFAPFFPKGAAGLSLAASIVVTWLFGFDIIPELAEESNFHPKRLAQLMVITPLLSAVVYILVLMGDLGLRPWDELASTPYTSAVLARQYYGDLLFYWIIFVGGYLALFTGINGFWVSSARVIYGMARAGLLPVQLAALNRWNSPGIANWTIFVVVVAFLALAGPNWIAVLATITALMIALMYALVCAAHIRLRSVAPDLQRPFRTPGGVWTAALGLVISVVLGGSTIGGIPREGWAILALYLLVGAVLSLRIAALRRKQGLTFDFARGQARPRV